jgi:Flp pilus assembly pilin Flp
MQKVKQIARRIADKSDGQSMVEYTIVLTTVALVAIGSFQLLPGPIASGLDKVSAVLKP